MNVKKVRLLPPGWCPSLPIGRKLWDKNRQIQAKLKQTIKQFKKKNNIKLEAHMRVLLYNTIIKIAGLVDYVAEGSE